MRKQIERAVNESTSIHGVVYHPRMSEKLLKDGTYECCICGRKDDKKSEFAIIKTYLVLQCNEIQVIKYSTVCINCCHKENASAYNKKVGEDYIAGVYEDITSTLESFAKNS